MPACHYLSFSLIDYLSTTELQAVVFYYHDLI